MANIFRAPLILPVQRRRPLTQADSFGTSRELLDLLPQSVIVFSSPPPLAFERSRKFFQTDIPPNLLLATLRLRPAASLQDWPTPVRARATQHESYPNQIILQIAPLAAVAPFTPTDTTQSVGRRQVTLEQAQNLTLTLPVTQAAPPFSQLDWATPVARRADLQPWQTSRSIAVVIPPPFVTPDFGAPTRARYTAQDSPQSALLTVLGILPAPFSQADWQITYRARSVPPDVTQNTLLLLSQPPVVLPFAQYDWITPLKALDRFAYGLDWLNSQIPNTIPPYVPPEPIATTIIGAGRRRRRMYVEIDGQEFDVESIQHAQALLDQAKALARQVALQKAEERLTVHLATNPRIRPKIERPQIVTHSPELHVIVAQTREVISNVYKAAYRDAEIRLRLAQQLADDDSDDEDLMLLL
jgi:hypothetical protein